MIRSLCSTLLAAFVMVAPAVAATRPSAPILALAEATRRCLSEAPAGLIVPIGVDAPSVIPALVTALGKAFGDRKAARLPRGWRVVYDANLLAREIGSPFLDEVLEGAFRCAFLRDPSYWAECEGPERQGAVVGGGTGCSWILRTDMPDPALRILMTRELPLRTIRGRLDTSRWGRRALVILARTRVALLAYRYVNLALVPERLTVCEWTAPPRRVIRRGRLAGRMVEETAWGVWRAVPRVSVTVDGPSGVRRTATGDDGRFSFDDLEEGSYGLRSGDASGASTPWPTTVRAGFTAERFLVSARPESSVLRRLETEPPGLFCHKGGQGVAEAKRLRDLVWKEGVPGYLGALRREFGEVGVVSFGLDQTWEARRWLISSDCLVRDELPDVDLLLEHAFDRVVARRLLRSLDSVLGLHLGSIEEVTPAEGMGYVEGEPVNADGSLTSRLPGSDHRFVRLLTFYARDRAIIVELELVALWRCRFRRLTVVRLLTPPASLSTGSVRGVVARLVDGCETRTEHLEGVAGSRVELRHLPDEGAAGMDDGGGQPRGVASTPDGWFEFPGLVPGSYRLVARRGDASVSSGVLHVEAGFVEPVLLAFGREPGAWPPAPLNAVIEGRAVPELARLDHDGRTKLWKLTQRWREARGVPLPRLFGSVPW